MKNKFRLIAFYLPQFHPIPENDNWWGKGFTEWTNVSQAKPLFRGHYQPKIPADLGYYDLRLEEIRIEQANLAKEAGIEGFCYWHYWFGDGKRLLERPFNEVLASGRPDFPFCLGWANHSWSHKIWSPSGSKNSILIEQKYPGVKDIVSHFYTNLQAFKDPRYIKIDNKPVFLIWDINNIPNTKEYLGMWKELALKNGLTGIYFIGFSFYKENIDEILENGYDSVCFDNILSCFQSKNNLLNRFKHYKRKLLSQANIVDYNLYAKKYVDDFPYKKKVHACIYPNFDHTPRSGKYGRLLINSSPEKYVRLLKTMISKQEYSDSNGEKLLFIKSWNEWGEGNYLEPDIKFGRAFINEMKKIIFTND